MKKVFSILVLALLWPLVIRADEPKGGGYSAYEAYTSLMSTSTFAIGGVGFAGTTSGPELALREVLKQPDAVATCQKLVANATVEGQLYGLLGLKLSDDKAFTQALPKFKNSKTAIKVMSGCILGTDKVGEVAERIEKGVYK
ncbi:hypothetical protein DES53_10594 [Roseimicrobium gellanilyticum]|uniref:DUF3015 domain-containing protein n=1 Tax=Roseimicrobium gellanilyticum TaxID=748857 RepID=A0A366HNZ0_9BACT|nr:hypothetical protein [Roseimicrobium gellanilyticum]RBP43695.1 hypothetical protein DES53_10594 [Roseimicrobium gellanilyticum]